MDKLHIYKLQWSIKLDNGEIFVCQADDAEELGLAVEEIKSKFLGKPTAVAEKAAIQQYSESTGHLCSEHGVEMKQRAYKDTSKGFYYDHRSQIQGVWKKCFGNGKGWV